MVAQALENEVELHQQNDINKNRIVFVIRLANMVLFFFIIISFFNFLITF